MSSSRAGDTLSVRLKALRAFHTNEQHIWDIGCDHGLLGLAFSDCPSIKSIHLVDPSKPVIDTLLIKLKDSYITNGRILIHQKHGQDLKIESSDNCIFIAGMGGKEIGQIIQNLLPQLDETSRIIISPHRKILELRKLLHALPISLLSENVLFEDGQFYQMLCLGAARNGIKVSLFGDSLWATPVGEAYRQHQIKHFTPHTDLASREYLTYLKGANP